MALNAGQLFKVTKRIKFNEFSSLLRLTFAQKHSRPTLHDNNTYNLSPGKRLRMSLATYSLSKDVFHDRLQDPFTRKEKRTVSRALGLREDFLNRLESIPEYIRCHRGHQGWVLIFIENKYDDINDEAIKTMLSEKFLRKLGFIDSDVMEEIMKRSKAMHDHLDPIDFVKRFIEDEFKYVVYPTLIPHNTPIHHFSCFNAQEQSEPNSVRLFHGTDRLSAEDIISNGIEVYFGMPKRDFSDGIGFYLTDNFEYAKTWAQCLTRKPVVLEFKIPEFCLKEERTLDLSNKETEPDWLEIVENHRAGSSSNLRQHLKVYDCISGPVSRTVSSSPGAAGKLREPIPGSFQICILSEDLADKIYNNAKYKLYAADLSGDMNEK